MKKIVLFSLLSLVIALPVFAAGLVPCGGIPACCEAGCRSTNCGGSNQPICCTPGCVNGSPPACEPRCGFCHLIVLFQNTLQLILFTIVPPVAIIIVGIAALLFAVGSVASPMILNQAKGILNSVMLGLIIGYGAWIFVNTFFVLIGLSSTNLGADIRNWFKISCPAP